MLPLLLVRDEGDVQIIFGASRCSSPASASSSCPRDSTAFWGNPLPEDLLVDANSSLQAVEDSYRLFGPLLGAALFAWTGGWVVALVDAASFLVAAAVISTIRVEEEAPEHEEAATGRSSPRACDTSCTTACSATC